MDCGPTCLRMVAKHYGRAYSIAELREASQISREGVSLLGISEAAEQVGFQTLAVKIDTATLATEAPLPCILHWNQNHFVVLYKISSGLFSKKKTYHIADPAAGKVKIDEATFAKCWIGNQEGEGIALLLEPTAAFYTHKEAIEKKEDTASGLGFLWQYVRPFRSYFIQIGLAMLLGSFMELLFPFLTQSLVDTGIANQNIGFVYIILIAQLMLFMGKTFVEMIRSWLLLHISTRINITIISSFIRKLMQLPLSFFDTKLIGDITQRIGDHHRIEQFLTGGALSTFFSLINLLVFSAIMAYYNGAILGVFVVGSVLSIAWVLLFMRWRKNIDYARFTRMSENQNQIYELINGMPDIKLSNAELQERWRWERIQAKIFKLNTQSLALEQWQMTGSKFLDQLKNIFISFLAAKAVIDGQMTLGMMMSVTYIIGQMNAPIALLLEFVRSAQDASISLDRLKEIHNKENEESLQQETITTDFDNRHTIRIENLSFKYNALDEVPLFDQLTLAIPAGKVTAIVGSSGSGKTTLLKLLLKFYEPQAGAIYLEEEIYKSSVSFSHISASAWRSRCGVVMQDGYLFSKSIAENIALGNEQIDTKRLHHAVHVANIKNHIEELPLKYNTKLGSAGNGLSQGQKQRMLIARAVYKNPDYIFFDEATSALDANNESVIMRNLDEFFKGKTVVVVAHRLSTVKNADKIVVLEKGKIIEEGTHSELTAMRGAYFNLVKNQLELGN